MSLIQDFKAFAIKGNAIDMAVGVIIGGAFGKIVTSLVNDIIMPPIGWLIGGVNFTDLSCKLPTNPLAEEGSDPVVIAYGSFLQTCLDFFLIALCVFFMIRLITKLNTPKEEAPAEPAAPAEPSKEETLLTEIRDLLKNK